MNFIFAINQEFGLPHLFDNFYLQIKIKFFYILCAFQLTQNIADNKHISL